MPSHYMAAPPAPRLRSRRGAVNTASYAPGVGLTVAGAWLAFSSASRSALSAASCAGSSLEPPPRCLPGKIPASSCASRSALSPASCVGSSLDLNAPLVGAGLGVGVDDWADVNVPVARSTPIIKATAETPTITQLCSLVIVDFLSLWEVEFSHLLNSLSDSHASASSNLHGRPVTLSRSWS